MEDVVMAVIVIFESMKRMNGICVMSNIFRATNSGATVVWFLVLVCCCCCCCVFGWFCVLRLWHDGWFVVNRYSNSNFEWK